MVENNPDEIDSRGAEHRYTTYQIFTEWIHRALVGVIGLLVIYSHYTAWSLKEKLVQDHTKFTLYHQPFLFFKLF